ncbi:DUF6090 family protein [Marinirhabdus gelatinilytica]|uniref:Uncharacterized protein n=1 Tax=Marinirhabdus gelatinilytica TaxID=1703343 RepID=A0A370Q591_9FLAO|nr:DUF6090 family protein [Marinirhabdus gelatinilytica]RDK83533.1 hypothetical protein C8D94_10770 [Marinirhabdus gelatinilytica]
MIKFFRKIRQKLLAENKPALPAGKFSKYLLYAIGEIILVVVGILIAINLNNTNQQNALTKSVDLKLNLLRHSVYQDSISMQGLIDYSKKQITEAERLLQLMNEPMNEDNCEEFIVKFSNHINIRTNIADRAIYDEMVNSGVFSEVEKQGIKSQIATYYQLSNHFNDIIKIYVRDFRDFKNNIATTGKISRAYFDPASSLSKIQRCEYVESLINSEENKLILENFIYTGIDTYEEIKALYSVLINQMINGLPKKPE